MFGLMTIKKHDEIMEKTESTHESEIARKLNACKTEHMKKVEKAYSEGDKELKRATKEFDKKFEVVEGKNLELDEELIDIKKTLDKKVINLDNAHRNLNRLKSRNSRAKNDVSKFIDEIGDTNGTVISQKRVVQMLMKIENRLDGDVDKKTKKQK